MDNKVAKESLTPAADAGPRQPEATEPSRRFVWGCVMGHRFIETCSPDPPEGMKCKECYATAVPLIDLDAVPPAPQEAAPRPEIGSNSVTYGENSSPYGETHICPTCNGYHAGGCHRAKATAPDWAMQDFIDPKPTKEQWEKLKNKATGVDWAMRVSVDVCRELYDRFVMGGWTPSDAHEQCAEFIREAGSERERKLEDALRVAVTVYRDHTSRNPRGLALTHAWIAEASRLLGGESK